MTFLYFLSFVHLKFEIVGKLNAGNEINKETKTRKNNIKMILNEFWQFASRVAKLSWQ